MPHQVEFVFDDVTPMQGLVGGYRSGKSEALCWKAIRCAAELFPGKEGVIISPIAGMNNRNILPILRRILPGSGLAYDVKRLAQEDPKHLDIYIGNEVSKIWLNVSAESYSRMNGMSLAWGAMDEADLCRTANLGYAAFMELGNRLSESPNAIQFAVSTPEGFGFMHRRFVTEASDKTKIWHCKMTDNFLLPKSYIQSRLENIPACWHAAYLNGEFANMTIGAVYPDYDSVENWSTKTWASFPGAPINLGIDFNVKNMSIVACIIQNGDLYVVDEIIGDRNTKSAIASIQARDWFQAGREIFLHPDKSGISEDSTSDSSDFVQLQEAFGFDHVITEDDEGRRSNPRIKDRVISVNARIKNGVSRNFFVNKQTCPVTHKALMQQPYNDKGLPLKDGVMDGPADAVGYVTWSYFPVRNHHWAVGGSLG